MFKITRINEHTLDKYFVYGYNKTCFVQKLTNANKSYKLDCWGIDKLSFDLLHDKYDLKYVVLLRPNGFFLTTPEIILEHSVVRNLGGGECYFIKQKYLGELIKV